MSSEFVSSLLQWLNANPQLAGLATFIISAAESVAIIGTVVPGSVTMTAIGTLAGAGVIPLWGTIIWAILGAVVGDGISYWMGYYFKDQIRRMWPFKNNPGVLGMGENFVHKYGITSVFIGRFVGPVRALVPLVAGMLGMRPIKFTIANVTSAIGWAPAYMLPGIILGAASHELPADIALHAILAGLLMVMFAILCLWITFKLIQLLHHQTNKLQRWISKQIRTRKSLATLHVFLQHHQQNKSHHQIRWIMIFILSTLTLFATGTYIKWHGGASVISINDISFHFFRSIHSAHTSNIMLYLTLLGQKEIVLPVAIVLCAFFFLTKRWRVATHVLALVLLTTGGVVVLKQLFTVIRPWGIMLSPQEYSMPSGHTTLAVTIYFMIAFLLSRHANRLTKAMCYTIAFLLTFFIGVSRLYLSAHWFTDVFSAWLLGIAILSLLLVSYQRQMEAKLNRLAILIVCLLTLSISYPVYSYKHFNALLSEHTQLDYPTVKIASKDWWETNNSLPAYQVNLIGFPSQKINLAWAGSIESIKDTLLKQGWEEAPERDWISVLHRVTDISSTQYLPLISQQYLDKNPALVLVKRNGVTLQYVLRFWDANRIIAENNQEIWVGVITTVPRSFSWILRKHINQVAITPQLIFTNPRMNKTWEWKEITMTLPAGKKKTISQPMLLIRQK